MVSSEYYVWVEIGANKQRIIHPQVFESMLDKCIQAGIGSIILSAKDTSGFSIYKSAFVPHYRHFDNDFEDTDYLKEYIDLAHKKGLKLYAAVDVFAEGRVKEYNPLSPGFIHTEWQTQLFGIDEKGSAAIRPVSDLSRIRTTGSIDDFHEVFVNPVREDVRNYELEIIKELIAQYDIDGIVLDRVRFVGMGSDFSDYTRRSFEKYIGGDVKNWPEDVYRLEESGDGMHIEYGHLFGKWMTFRASIIKQFIIHVQQAVKESKKIIEFLDYTGSWYPLYYQVGANWASDSYIPEEYPWVGKEYSETGYAEHIDKLLSGFYYPDVTVKEALEHGKPAYWYSVEGSGDMAERVVKKAVPVIGSLFLKQYEGNPEAFGKAVDMCFQKSQGCMLFDLCYVDDYDWWNECRRDPDSSKTNI